MKNEKKLLTRSAKVPVLSSTMVLISCVLYIVLICATVQTYRQYQAMASAVNTYIACEKDAKQVSDGSNYLTEQVQLYVTTLDSQYMHNYFTEANVTCRRETAVNKLKEFLDDDALLLLQEALNRSNQLMEVEFYAMRLATQTQPYNLADLPEEIQQVRLTSADLAMGRQGQLEKARTLVFGPDYQFAKTDIMDDISLFLSNAVEITRQNQQDSTSALRNIMMVQSVLLVLLIIQSVITFLLIILHSRRKQKENKTFINQIIHSFAKSIDIKDKYTNGHSFRVAKYAGMIARKVGFSAAQAEDVYNIGLLHDIGKITVPDSILHKPSRLSDEEFAVMKAHAMNGCEILQAIEIAPELALGAAYHHERIDGRGYPAGRKGDEIPEVAQIIAVADTFDAMYSTRPYRKQMPIDAVVEELKRASGTQLNAKYVDALLKLIEEGAVGAD